MTAGSKFLVRAAAKRPLLFALPFVLVACSEVERIEVQSPDPETRPVSEITERGLGETSDPSSGARVPAGSRSGPKPPVGSERPVEASAAGISGPPAPGVPTWSCEDRPCEPEVSCSDCALRLRRAEDAEGADYRLTLEYRPEGNEPRARLADVRLFAPPGVELESAVASAELRKAGKDLYQDEQTGARWKRRSDGSYQLLVLGMASTDFLPEGDLASLTFRGRAEGAGRFSLVRRGQVLAPARADAALQRSSYHHQLQIQN